MYLKNLADTSSRRFVSSFHGKRFMGTYSDIYQRREQTGCELCQLLIRSLTDKPTITTTNNDSARCRLSWVLDGRLAPGMVKRTRRLAIEWVAIDAVYEPSYIVLVAPDGRDAGDANFFLGRRLANLGVANFQLVERWLSLCRESHPDCRIDHTSPTFLDLQSQACFMVLDVKGMLLRELPEGAKYAALSYTWGPPDGATALEKFTATDLNTHELEKENGVAEVLGMLPLAIRNAIALTRRLGIDYIWIDSLCIMQGNEPSWGANARFMDSIYGNAELTICAADGDGADSGLQALYALDIEHPDGYTRGAEYQAIAMYSQETEDSVLELMLSWPSDAHISVSRWNSRAWTFQERMLSKRCLICVNKSMYLHPPGGSTALSVELTGAAARTFSTRILRRLATNPVAVYEDCIQMYTFRQLSDESDILSAFAGIGKVLCKALARNAGDETALLFGLPASHLDYALLWQPNECPERRCLSNAYFPSWSWSGWETGMGRSPRPWIAAEATRRSTRLPRLAK
ncbi:hypothetical protein LTR56_002816 [Elasticomyces elasticus]|nr:hypothetical protein LTR56_002816 [Elasticomyces elasticus]KAK4920431.1 hypothetical protein LTR49_012023 [Elasticomyces elasticus]KAK5759282.1 hypothetical protein LTS12_010605 [Elasticomyces elasticus]